MTSIWENDFYETPPQPLYAFESVWDQYTELGSNYYQTLTKACTTIQVAAREIQMTPVYYGGLEFRYPARTNNAGELTVGFAENNKMEITSILYTLFDKSSYNQRWANRTAEDVTKYREEYNKQANKIIVKVLRPDANLMYNTDGGEYSKKFIFNNCTLIKIDGVDFDVTSEDVVNITATFSFDYMTTEEGQTEEQQGTTNSIIAKESVASDGNTTKKALEDNIKNLPKSEKLNADVLNGLKSKAPPDSTDGFWNKFGK